MSSTHLKHRPDRRELMQRFGRPLRELAIEKETRTGRPSGVARATAMRLPGAQLMQTKAVPEPPSPAVIAFNRMGFGQRPGDKAAFEALGSNDVERLTAYVDQQINPASIDDSACDARIAAGGFATLNKSQAQLWLDHVEADVSWSERMQPFFVIERMAFLRGVHS